MEDFQKRLYKEWLELELKTIKNSDFIWNNPKFQELDTNLQKAQLKQYFAQEEYIEALKYRIQKLGDYGAFTIGLRDVFLDKLKGKTIQCTNLRLADDYKYRYIKDIYNIGWRCDWADLLGENSSIMSIKDIVLYALIVDEKVKIDNMIYQVLEPECEVKGDECHDGREMCQALENVCLK